MLFRSLILLALLSVSACSSWIYRIDVPQGNYIETKDINKLQLAMTKEQVRFILGSPVIVDTFNTDTWYYTYRFKSGRDEKLNIEKTFKILFKDGKISSAEGSYELPESFYVPIKH